jgi:hypothetical protein
MVGRKSYSETIVCPLNKNWCALKDDFRTIVLQGSDYLDMEPSWT